MNPSLYREIINATCPELTLESLITTDWGGQNNDIVLVNDNLIFRFPKYQFGMSLIEGEVATLRFLRPKITLPIPTPIYTHVGIVGEAFIAYPMLSGDPLTHERLHALDDATQQRIADQLANYLRELHSIPAELSGVNIGRMQAALHHLFDIPYNELEFESPVNDGLVVWRGMYAGFRRHLYPHMRDAAKVETDARFEAYFNTPALHQYEPRWRHGDFGSSNILFDGENISGVLDFSFTGIGDAALDIAAISTYGDRFFNKLLTSYPEANEMLARAQFYRASFALEEALHGVLHDDPVAFQAGIEEYV